MTVLAKAFDDHRRFCKLESFGKLHCRYSYFFYAGSMIAIRTQKMYMIVLVLACTTFIPTEGI